MTPKIMLVDISKQPNSVRVLFDLLLARIDGISHKVMPSFEDHSDFVTSHPYKAWYFILEEEKPIGSCYVTSDNSIGINAKFRSPHELSQVVKCILERHTPEPEVKSVRPPYFHLSVSYENIEIQDQLAALGITPIQLSFRIPPQL